MSRRFALVLLVALLLIGVAAVTTIIGFVAPAGVGPTPTSVAVRDVVAPAGVGPTHTSVAVRDEGPFQVLFTDPIYPDRPENRRASLDAELAAFIDQSEQRLDVAIYDLDLENVARALARAKERGVRVRLVTDQDTLTDERNEKVQRAFNVLRQAGVPIVADNRSGIMHHKFIVRDGQTVWTGSWNFTENDAYRYNNNAIVIHSSELATAYQLEFEQMFSERLFGPNKRTVASPNRIEVAGLTVEVYFAPADRKIVPRLVELIDQAKTSVHFLAFSFTHDRIGEAVRRASNRGTQVAGVLEKAGSGTIASEMASFRQAGIDVYPDANPYAMHHKVIVIDNETVITGSFNFSANAERVNDENLLVIHSPEIAQKYASEFQKLFRLAKPR